MGLENLRKHFDRVGRFRILVIGRANSGKTTILQRIRDSTECLEIFNAKGDKLNPVTVQESLESKCLDIEGELVFQSNPGLIFHDSRGFEAGLEQEVNVVRNFIADRAVTTNLENRIHAIWFCIPLTDYERPIMALEECFFDKWNTANVPVIVVLTKADRMKWAAIGQLRDEDLTIKDAMLRAEPLATQLLSDVKTRIENKLAGFRYPPQGYLALSCMNKNGADCGPLLRYTAHVLDDAVLQEPVVSTQQVDISPYIEYTVKMDLTRQLRKESNYPCTAGAFGDIWKCYWFRDSDNLHPALVAVKVIRTHDTSDKAKEKKRFHREIGIWRRLNHRNIVPLYGVAYGFGFYPAMVCPWAPKGTLGGYLRQYHETFSRDVKFQLLDDVANGLEYLHNNHVTHGDLTGNNVLIFGDGSARLADFGMSTALKELWGSAYFTKSARGCLRWAAPELFQSDDEESMAYIGPACDVYSFGSIILQVLSGKVPYFYLTDIQMLVMVMRGIPPKRPKEPNIDDEGWGIIQWCWTAESINRPEIGEVTNRLKSLKH